MTRQQLLSFLIFMWNFLVFVIYGMDKGKARKGLYRIPEKLLLLSSVCLGGAGAALAGYFFHHKTRKWYFKATWLLGIVIKAAVLYWIWRM